MRIFSLVLVSIMLVLLTIVTAYGLNKNEGMDIEDTVKSVTPLKPSQKATPMKPIQEIPDGYKTHQYLTGAGREDILNEKEAYLEEESKETLMHFTATAYCPCEKCCGKSEDDPAYGFTASGYNVFSQEKNIVAADTNVLPFGTKIEIFDLEGNSLGIYYVEDIGGAIDGNRLDVFHMTHDEAIEFGLREVVVEVLCKPDAS